MISPSRRAIHRPGNRSKASWGTGGLDTSAIGPLVPSFPATLPIPHASCNLKYYGEGHYGRCRSLPVQSLDRIERRTKKQLFEHRAAVVPGVVAPAELV